VRPATVPGAELNRGGLVPPRFISRFGLQLLPHFSSDFIRVTAISVFADEHFNARPITT
jgi:hypothetical protein